MRTNNLLMSLLANNPNSRANSVAGKHGLSPSLSFMPRSTSTSAHKRQANSVQTSTQLVKLTHFLNVKVKQNYYHAFCKLQQIYKQTLKYKTQTNTQPVIIRQQNITPNTQKQITNTNNQKINNASDNRPAQIKKSLQIICDFQNTIESKIFISLNKVFLQNSFQNIHKYSQKKSSAQIITKLVNAKVKDNYRSLFLQFVRQQKYKMRIQILGDSLTQIRNKKIKDIFACISSPNSYKDNKHKLKTQSSQILFSQRSNMSEMCLNEILQKGTCQPFLSDQMSLNKSKKIILKQKKVATSTPIFLFPFTKISKANKIIHKQNIPLQISQEGFSQKLENMTRIMNLKHENMNHPLPDLTDTCNIFRQMPLPTDSSLSKRTITQFTQISAIQYKKSIDILPTEDCLTDRYKRQPNQYLEQPQRQNTSKHKSLGNVKASLNTQQKNHSPLKKVQEMLKSVKSVNNGFGVNKQKRMININIPTFYQKTVNSSPIKLQYNQTPLKQQRSDLSNFKSLQKVLRERLITERQKQKCSKEDVLESGQKYKSSVLVREKKLKADKNHIFTARKMKMQIENIINRRNKQVGIRNQLYQLK